MGVELSVTVIVKMNWPTVFGVPEITPAVLSVKPGGSVPEETLQV
jgi:hypothetical protein